MPFGFGDTAPAPAAGAPGAAPADPFKPSALDVALGVLFHGDTPADEALRLRAQKASAYQNQLVMQAMQGAMQGANPDELKAMIFNPTEYGKAQASHYQATALNGGQTLVNGPGGQPYTATTYGVDNSTPYALGPEVKGGFQSGPQMPGKTEVDASSGALYNNSGPTGARLGRPQIVPLGSSLQDFRGSVSGAPGLPQTSATPTTQPGQGGQNAPLDGASFFRSFILPHEGGLNPADMNGSPTKYGINQAANPGVDVKSLTPNAAEQVFLQKYWKQSGAANMPAPLAAVHADTYFINPKMANSFLEQSGGDPRQYLALREAWMSRLAQNNPRAAVYAGAWSKRNADLHQFIDGTAPSAQAPAAEAGTLPAQVSTVREAQGKRILTAEEAKAKGFAPGAVVELSPDGSMEVRQSPEYGPEQKSTLRNQVMNSDEYKQANAAVTAYNAMIANAKTMTGPAAYAMLDTFARAINPGAVARPQVIETIEKSLGPLNGVQGGWSRVLGEGSLTPQVRQQIIDAVVPFAQAHWDQANHLNAANADLAKAHGFDAADVTAPLGGRPQGVSIAALEAGIPVPAQRKIGQVYPTPKGPMTWQADGWHPAGGR